MKNTVNIVCLIFLVTAPIGQWIFGLGGGFIVFLFSPNEGQQIAPKLMGILSLVSIFGFAITKSKIGKLITTIFSTFFICNFVLFYSMEHKITSYFYPQCFVIGSIVSFIILKLIEKINPESTDDDKPKLGWWF